MSDENCKNCRFAGEGDYSWKLVCRRRAPQVVSSTYTSGNQYSSSREVTSALSTKFPEVDEHMWCGEWEPADKTTPNGERE